MTCVAAVVHRGRVYMGADSAVVQGSKKELLARPKVRRHAGLLIGACGHYAAIGAILDATDFPRFDGSDVAEWITCIAWPAIHTALRALSIWRAAEYTALLGIGGKLATVDHRASVVVYKQSYAAIGSGGDIALGVLATGWRRLSPTSRVRGAIEIAAQHCNDVDGRVSVLRGG